MTKQKTQSNNQNIEVKSSRSLSVDRFRGLAILFVVLSVVAGAFLEYSAGTIAENSFLGFIGKLLGHHTKEGLVLIPNFSTIVGNGRAGLALADLFAPMFIFIIGLTLTRSFKSREEKYGTKQAYFQLAIRFLSLIGVGLILNGLENVLEIVGEGETFAGFKLADQIFIIAMVVAVVALIAVGVISFFKNEKLRKISKDVLKYFFATVGVIGLVFLSIRTVQRLGKIDEIYGSGWDVLQNIGLAGLFALPFVKYDKWGKMIVIGIALTGLIILTEFGGAGILTANVEGGLWGAFGWGSILLLGSVFEEIKNKKYFYYGLAVGLIALSLILSLGFKTLMTKRGASTSYAMLTAGFSALIYGGISLLENYKPKFAFFTWWGANPILTYISAILLAMVIAIVSTLANIVIAPWLIAILVVVIVAVYTTTNWLLYKNKKFIKI